MSSLTDICLSPQLDIFFQSGVTLNTQCAVVTKLKCSFFCSMPQINAGMRACACTRSNFSFLISFFSPKYAFITLAGFLLARGSVTWHTPAASSISAYLPPADATVTVCPFLISARTSSYIWVSAPPKPICMVVIKMLSFCSILNLKKLFSSRLYHKNSLRETFL